MEELIDLMVADASPSDVSSKIKDVLFAKSSERIDGIKPNVAVSMFDNNVETEIEVEQETEG
tara:strand:- start:534 stop:719 length:186 start_codon:yes stop_codon:yes gene_type:complete